MTRFAFRLLPFAAVPAVLVVAAACSSNNNSSSNSTSATKPPAAASVSAGVAGTAAAGGQAAAGASQSFDEVATDNKFSVTKMTAPANKPITVNLSNKGAAVHNWELLGADGKVMKDASGKDIKGALLDAGKSEALTFTVDKPGTYKFQCEVHPADMTGTMTVQ